MSILTSLTFFHLSLMHFFLGTSFAYLQTWDNLSSYAHSKHRYGMHMNHSSEPFEFEWEHLLPL